MFQITGEEIQTILNYWNAFLSVNKSTVTSVEGTADIEERLNAANSSLNNAKTILLGNFGDALTSIMNTVIERDEPIEGEVIENV